MAEVIWTEPALNALDEIGDYIAIDDYDAACNLVRRFFEKIDLLEKNSELGNIPKELKHTRYRRLVVRPVHIYYRIEEQKVIIVYVERAKRDFSMTRLIEFD